MEKLPDSGERREFETGSVRDRVDGKGAFHLLSPFALRAYAKRMEDGMSKYGERNWEKGQPVMTYLDSASRHINDYTADCMTGEAPKEDHLGAALWNIAAAIHTVEMIERGLLPKSLDNRPTPPPGISPEAEHVKEADVFSAIQARREEAEYLRSLPNSSLVKFINARGSRVDEIYGGSISGTLEEDKF